MEQMQLYAKTKGYFYTQVKDSLSPIGQKI